MILYADGGSRGNPGPAASGAYLTDSEDNPVARVYKYIGETTNNVAEYSSLIFGLKEAIRRGAKSILIRMDSQLVVRQIEGKYRVKEPTLQKLHAQAMELLKNFQKFDLEHIPREQNDEADRLVNLALDQELEK